MKKSKISLALPLAFAALLGCSSALDLYAPVDAPKVASKFSPKEVFSTSTQGVGNHFSRLSPVIMNDILYVAGRNGEIKALNTKTGKEIWSKNLSNLPENDEKRSARVSGGVAAQNNLLALGTENGYVYLINATNGKLKWKKYVGGEVIAKPAFSKSGSTLFVVDSYGSLTSIDTETGTENYVAGEAPNSLRLRSQSAPVTVGDDFVLLGQSNGKVSVYLQSTGAIVNQLVVSLGVGANSLERLSDVSSTPLVLGSDLYATAYNGSLVKYSFSDNRIVSKLGYESSQDIAFDDENIVITDDKGHVYCIDRNTNQEKWSNQSLTYRKTSAPAIYGNYAVVGDYDGQLYFLSLDTGAIESKIDLDNTAIYVAPIVHNGLLYVIAKDGSLYCLDYDPAEISESKEAFIKIQKEYAGLGVNLMAPGVGAVGIYAPGGMSKAQLEERRRHIINAVQAEARQKAEIDAQRRAYEKHIKEQKKRLSGFGINPGAGVTSE